MSKSILAVARHPARAAVIVALAMLALGLTVVFGHTGSPDNHIGTNCGAAAVPCPNNSTALVAGVEIDSTLDAGDATAHGGTNGKDWDASPRTPDSGETIGDNANALINEGGAGQLCPPNQTPQLSWNEGPGLLDCDLSAATSTPSIKDDVFSLGSKGNAEKQWVVANPGAPKKGDLDNVYLLLSEVQSGDTAFCGASACPTNGFDTPVGDIGDDVIVGALTKTDTDGDSHNDFELRQSICSTDFALIASCPRVEGDVLVTLDTSSNQVLVQVFFWEECTGPCTGSFTGDGVAEGGEDCILPTGDVAAATSGCWDIVPVSHPLAIGIFNFDGVKGTGGGIPAETADDEVDGVPWLSFGCEKDTENSSTQCTARTQQAGATSLEFSVNLTQLNIEPQCPGFGTFLAKGRSSTSITSALKDVTPIRTLPISCAISWEKRDESQATSGVHPLQGGATFTVTGDAANDPDPGDSDGPRACLDDDNTGDDDANPLTVVDNGTNDSNPTAGQITLSGICFGSYTVTETVAPAGYALDDDTTRVIVVSGADENPVIGTQSTDDHVQASPPSGVADCTSNSDECDFHNRRGSLAWEKRDESQGSNGSHPLQGGATFTVSPNPDACLDADSIGPDDTDPLVVVDDGDNTDGPGPDDDGTAGEIVVGPACLATYTITETVAPAGFALDDDTDRVCTVTALALSCVVGEQGDDNDDVSGDSCDTDSNECDFHNRLGTLEWEKRDESTLDGDVHPLQGGATFEVSPNPFACHDADSVGDDDTSPLVVTDDELQVEVIDTEPDEDFTPGQFLLLRVCLGTYTVTETAAPAGWAIDDDPDRSVTVTAAALTQVIGTQSTDDHEGTGTGVEDCTSNLDECDFHNRRGALYWEKRAKDATCTSDCPPLLGGAVFSIDRNPHTGDAGAFEVTDCIVDGVTVTDCSTFEDKDPVGGQFCLESVVLDTALVVSETSAPAGYLKDSTTRPVMLENSGTCASGFTSVDDFINKPLSEIEVIFRSLAGGEPIAGAVAETECDGVDADPGDDPVGPPIVDDDNVVDDGCTVTKAQIVCEGAGGVETADDGGLIPGDTLGEDGAADSGPTFDDYNEVFTDLVEGTYTCTVIIDP